jgi:Galactose oxidase, central domain/Kelch motif
MNSFVRICTAISVTALLFSAACDDDPVVTTDGRVRDGSSVKEGGADLTPVKDAGDGGPGDALLKDLEPDGPKLPGSWKTVKGTPPQLEDHTATLLPSGDVLIAGGLNELDASKHQDAAYLYKPAQDDFVPAGKMTAARTEHTATLLPDGTVLVAGGKNAKDYLKTAEIYDPSKPAASAWTAAITMYKSRWGHAATALKDGRVLITGGFVSMDSTTSIVFYDPKTKSWQVPGAMMATGRRYHTSTLLKNGKVLLTGGMKGYSSSTWSYLDSIEIYDPNNGKMIVSKVKMSKKRVSHTATLLPGGEVLIVGGYCGKDCAAGKLVDDVYDPITDTISPLQHAGPLPSSHLAALLKDGRVLVAGDNDTTNNKNTLLYEPTGGGNWSKQPDMLQGRWGGSATRLNDGSVLVVGGVQNTNPMIYVTKSERFVVGP